MGECFLTQKGGKSFDIGEFTLTDFVNNTFSIELPFIPVLVSVGFYYKTQYIDYAYNNLFKTDTTISIQDWATRPLISITLSGKIITIDFSTSEIFDIEGYYCAYK